MAEKNEYRLLIAAGGTGGHLFPALAVVSELKKQRADKINVKFIGTSKRIEADVVPKLGYDFHTMPIKGFAGILSLQTWMLPFNIMRSLSICRKLIRKFKPDAVLCTGAYISYPAGISAYRKGIPLILMESNVNPGKTISLLSAKADLIISSFDETVNYFNFYDKNKVKNLGNPVRDEFNSLPDRETSLKKFGLNSNLKTILIFGGSLGAMTINKAVEKSLDYFVEKKIQVIWQCGKNYKFEGDLPRNIKLFPFIDDMVSAYSASDLVISRSGATTVAEIAICGKASVLIPLPSASNHEQEENAKALVDNEAAILLYNDSVNENLEKVIEEILFDDELLESMSRTVKRLAKPEAAKNAAKIILDLIDSKR